MQKRLEFIPIVPSLFTIAISPISQGNPEILTPENREGKNKLEIVDELWRKFTQNMIPNGQVAT